MLSSSRKETEGLFHLTQRGCCSKRRSSPPKGSVQSERWGASLPLLDWQPNDTQTCWAGDSPDAGDQSREDGEDCTVGESLLQWSGSTFLCSRGCSLTSLEFVRRMREWEGDEGEIEPGEDGRFRRGGRIGAPAERSQKQWIKVRPPPASAKKKTSGRLRKMSPARPAKKRESM